MKPEEIDKLFKERLGNSTPTPPADLWNRLQERIETEMPQAQKQEQKGGFMVWYRSYGIAAAVALLLAAGLVFFSLRNNQQQQAPTLAQTETPAPASPAEAVTPEPAETAPALAEVQQPAKSSTEASAPAPVAAPAQAIAKATPVAGGSGKKAPVKQIEPLAPVAPESTLAAATEPEKPALSKLPEPTAALAATAAERPERVEIIIKRSVAAQQVAMQPQEEAEELSGLEKKQQIAKSIFKQVKNLAAGERVEFSELGIRTEQIALETQIGKQKFSKVINL
ncbi:hypothetical protein FVR03_22095 [Pontibacter qinzhouensis]|uniref:Uncharacterized protein n=1 Tax=Pontibacter qinzhouensis TaxID=2603253 RepID=A0A5C8IW22_9BACT|nr:hypothetical protein [Pontibacter qinzhouensis]TXK25012.1 hypothetical protein FVR03_22095 [Pontibacter qinzhouensis]